jgi:type IV secretion system protein VirB4
MKLLKKLNFRLMRLKAVRETVADFEYKSSGFIRYKTHWNDTTVLTDNNELIQVIKISGFSFETADNEQLDVAKILRNLLLKSLSTGEISLYFHLVRRKQKIYPDDYASNDMPDGFALYLDQKWVEKHRYKLAFVNEIYISVIKRVSSAGVFSGIEGLMKSVLSGGDKRALENSITEACEELNESTNRLVTALRDYSPELLGIIKTGDGVYSEITEFFGNIINCGETTRTLLNSGPIAKQMCTQRLYFGKKSIEVKCLDGSSKFAGMVSIKEYGPRTWAGMLDGFLQMPFEFIMSQSFEFINRQLAINKMTLQQNRMRQAGDLAVTQTEEISVALDKAMSGEIGFGNHHLTVMCMASDPKELENALSLAVVEVTNTGGVGVRERVNMEPAFWGQLPGNFDFIVRKAVINTMNLAAFNSLHNYPVGKAKGNHWGSAVTVLDTTSGTPFYFNFHLRDVGHTTIIGPTGAGKTVLMNFLCAQSQKFKCRLFFFDKDRGAEIFIRALSGNYTVIDPGKKCGFNPLSLPNTGENRTFLLEWLKLLVTSHKEVTNAEDINFLTNAINGNYKLNPKDRKLSNIAPFLGLGGPGTLAGRLAMWIGRGSHATLFDNEEDVIDFGKASVFGFEMAELLKDPFSLGPALSYVFHRINLSLDGTPTMIVLDEAWALIDNPVFAPKIKDWLKVLRKLNTFVVFATQSVEDASKSAISDTLIQQTATQIFLPNLRATSTYRTTFMLSEREFQLIKSTDPGSRFFLVKQGNNSVIARVDLGGMSDVVNVLSGRASTVGILDEVRKQYGDDPKIWMPIFDKKVKEMSES